MAADRQMVASMKREYALGNFGGCPGANAGLYAIV